MKGSTPNCYVYTLKALYTWLSKKVTKRCMAVDMSPVTSTGRRRKWSEGVTLVLKQADEATVNRMTWEISRVMADFVVYLDELYPDVKHMQQIIDIGGTHIICRIGTVKNAVRSKPTTEGIDSFLLGKAMHYHGSDQLTHAVGNSE